VVRTKWLPSFALFSAGVAVCGLAVTAATRSAVFAGGQDQTGPSSSKQTDVAHLKDIVPPASHPLVEVGYRTVNLWFGAKKGNWPLANY
jgi:hypothetical protein